MNRTPLQPATSARVWTGRDRDTSWPVPLALRPPVLDEDAEAVITDAVATLGSVRGLEWVGDDGVTIHLLASLAAQAQALLGAAVIGALDQEYAWTDIAYLLGSTEAEARSRYGSQA